MPDNPTRDILNNHVIYEGGGVSELAENTYYEEYPIPLTGLIPRAFIANQFPVHIETPSNTYGINASKWKYIEIGLANYLGSAIYNAMTFPVSTTVTASYTDCALYYLSSVYKFIYRVALSAYLATYGLTSLAEQSIWFWSSSKPAYAGARGIYSMYIINTKQRQYHKTVVSGNSGAYTLPNPFASYITAGEVNFSYIWGSTDMASRKIALTPAYYRSSTGHNYYSSRTYDSSYNEWTFSGSNTWLKVNWEWDSYGNVTSFNVEEPNNSPDTAPTCPDFDYVNISTDWTEDIDAQVSNPGDPLIIEVEYIDKSALTDNKIYGYLPGLFQRLYNTVSEI